MSNLLTIKNLHCQYQDKQVLNGLTLSVDEDQILCLLGPSGCGKTTALKAIAGLLPSHEGEIHIHDAQVNGKGLFIPPEKRNLGMIFQDYALFPHMSVADNVGFALKDMSKDELADKVQQMLTLVKLEPFAQRYPHQLSGGQQQRVAIARALAYSPKLLLLDEPFSNIDTQVRLELIEEIREILKARKMSAVFVTHSKEEGFAFADQMAVMDKGTIAQIDTPEVLFNQPNTRFVAEFLGKGVYLAAKVLDNRHIETSLGVIESTAELAFDNGISGELFVRPQYFEIVPEKNSKAQITHQTFIGSGYNYQVDFAGQVIDVFAAQRLLPGTQVALKVIPHHLHLFDSN